MLGLEAFMMIQALVKRGSTSATSPSNWGPSPDGPADAAPGRAAGGTAGEVVSLDPYRPVIDQLLGGGVWNAVVLLRELQAKGYGGGISILRDYVRPKWSVRPGRATVRFETEPGRQLRMDCGEPDGYPHPCG
jgi:hypothetical protein